MWIKTLVKNQIYVSPVLVRTTRAQLFSVFINITIYLIKWLDILSNDLITNIASYIFIQDYDLIYLLYLKSTLWASKYSDENLSRSLNRDIPFIGFCLYMQYYFKNIWIQYLMHWRYKFNPIKGNVWSTMFYECAIAYF